MFSQVAGTLHFERVGQPTEAAGVVGTVADPTTCGAGPSGRHGGRLDKPINHSTSKLFNRFGFTLPVIFYHISFFH
jgi:hypothetical protein